MLSHVNIAIVNNSIQCSKGGVLLLGHDMGVVRMRVLSVLLFANKVKFSFAIKNSAVWALCTSLWSAFSPEFRDQNKKAAGNHQHASQKNARLM